MRRLVDEAVEARRANWRASKWRETSDRQYALARALEQLSFMVENITGLIVEQEHADRREVVLGPTLRPPTAKALQAMAGVLRSVEGATAERGSLERADEALRELTDAVRDQRGRTEDDLFAAGTIVTAVRRGVRALADEEMAERLDSTSGPPPEDVPPVEPSVGPSPGAEPDH
jgi:hypothetical protein